jgi:peptide/nickel transport system substrate-binding protein
MDNRFGFRDFILVVLLIAIGVLIWLSMVQTDRLHQDVRAMREAIETQTNNLSDLQRTLQDRAVRAPAAGDGNANATRGGASPTFPDPDEVQGEVTTFPDARPRVQKARQQPGFSQGGRMIDAFSSNVETLTPLIPGSANAGRVREYVLETLGELDPTTLEYRGLLARRWLVQNNVKAYEKWMAKQRPKLEEKAKNNPDLYQDQLQGLIKQAQQPPKEGTEQYQQYVRRAQGDWIDQQLAEAEDRPTPITIHFELRENLRFSDGQPLTAEDLVFFYDLAMNENINAPRQRAYLADTIDDVIAVSPRHLKVTFKKPYFEALQMAASSLQALPKHYYEDIPPSEFNTSKALLRGSGPYQLRGVGQWTPGETIILERNPRYWGPSPAFDQLRFRQYTNSTAELTAFYNGEIHALSPEAEQFEAMLDDEQLVEQSQHFNYMTPYNGYQFIAWNQRTASGQPTMFADPEVRRALTMLIDRKQMIDDILLNYGRVARGPFNPLGDQPAPELEPWPYDLERAKSLLEQAGWQDQNEDGLIENRDGKPLRFSFMYPAGSPTYKKIAFYLKDAFAAAGVDIKLNPLEFSVMIQRLKRKDFEAAALGWTSGPETDIYQIFHSDQILAEGDNFVSYRNPKLDRLIEKARFTIDRDQRMKLWHQCDQIIHEDQPYTFLFWGESLRFLNDQIENANVLRAGLSDRLEWYRGSGTAAPAQGKAPTQPAQTQPPPAPVD